MWRHIPNKQKLSNFFIFVGFLILQMAVGLLWVLVIFSGMTLAVKNDLGPIGAFIIILSEFLLIAIVYAFIEILYEKKKKKK